MRKVFLMAFYLLVALSGQAQEISKNYRADLGIYASVFDEHYKTVGANFPKLFTINGDMLTYVKEFLDDKSSAPGLKKYIMENGWDFLKGVDTAGRLKLHAQIGIEELRPFLAKGTRIAKKNTDLSYSFSPVIFSKDKTKAFLVFHKSHAGHILEVMTYFFECSNNRWKLITTMVPYYI